MNKPPAFQFYAADFDMDTNTWTNEEVGVYLRLLMSEWVNGPLPEDPSKLSKISRVGTKKFKKIFSSISHKFIKNGGGFLINKRLESEREKLNNFLKSQSESGKKGAKKRWKKHGKPNGDPIADPNGKPNGEKIALHLQSSLEDNPSKEGAYAPPSKDEIENESSVKLKKDIDAASKEIYDKNIFPKVTAWVNTMRKSGKNDRAILHTLLRCIMKPPKESCWAYCTRIISVENGNFNERDYQKTA